MSVPARHLVVVPTREEILSDPGLFDGLPAHLQDSIYEDVATLEARLRVKVLARRIPDQPHVAPECVVKIEDAVALLGMKKDYLYRHWKELGGYRDDDRRIKFPMRVIQRHIESRGRQ